MIWGVVSLVVSIISSVVQHRKQKKAEKKAKEEAEKRAGFQLTVKGEAQAVPIVYGRQKVGATLADVKTRNSYVYDATTGANNIWAIGAFSKLGQNITWDTDRYRNAILMTQYAICQGDIESIEHVEVDDVDYDDKEFNKANDARGAHRIVTYNAGGTPCPLATANGMPANNKFTDLAFATGVFFLSRDEPQYFQIPDVSFYVKGKKIPQVTESLGVYSYDRNTVSYSNNPALVLLDYLTGEYGMDLNVSDIDLKSFYDAAIICDLTVNPGAGALGAIQRRGHIWNRDGTNDYNQLNAYTLNGNSYLSFIGPSGATIDLSALQATLAGSGETYQVVAETGHYDIDFTNSSYNGTSDEIEVPVADTTPVDGATTIVTATDIPEYDLSQLVIRANTGENTLTLYECNITIDPSDTVRDNVASILNSMPGASLIWSEGKFKLRLPYYTSQTDLRNAAAATLVVTDDILANQAVKTIYPNADNKLNTASVRFLDEQDNFKQGTVTWPEKGGAVETAFLNEDNGVVLQNFLDGAGISDPYHATALAEQTVRESRRAVEYEFECFPDAYALEPGDVIRLNSEINNITSIDDILHVDKVTLKENMNVVVNAHLIHSSDYAWNIGAEILPPFSTRPSSFFLSSPITTNAEIAEIDLGNDTVYGYRAIPDDHKIFLRWKGSSPGSFYGYEVEYAYAGYTDDDDWIPAGQTRNETFDLFVGNPSLAVYVRVKTISITGGKSPPSLVMGPITHNLTLGTATVAGNLVPDPNMDDGTSEFWEIDNAFTYSTTLGPGGTNPAFSFDATSGTGNRILEARQPASAGATYRRNLVSLQAGQKLWCRALVWKDGSWNGTNSRIEIAARTVTDGSPAGASDFPDFDFDIDGITASTWTWLEGSVTIGTDQTDVAFGNVWLTFNDASLGEFRIAHLSLYTFDPRGYAQLGSSITNSNGTVITDSDILNADETTAWGFNPTFSNWSGTNPDGWVTWQGSIVKETSITSVGNNAVRCNATGSEVGIRRDTGLHSPTVSLSLPEDTVIIGSIDMYLVSYTSGNGAGILVDLVDGTGKKHRQEVRVDTSIVGAWQRQYFRISSSDATDINENGTVVPPYESVQIYIMGSWAAGTLFSEAFTGDIIFDNLKIGIGDPDTSRINRPNLLQDGQGTIPSNYWEVNNGGNWYNDANGSGWYWSSLTAVTSAILQTAGSGAGAPIPVTAGKTYSCYYDVICSSYTQGSIYVDFFWYDSSGTILGGGLGDGINFGRADPIPEGSWTRFGGSVTAPTGAAKARLRVVTTNLTATWVRVTNIKVNEGGRTPYTNDNIRQPIDWANDSAVESWTGGSLIGNPGFNQAVLDTQGRMKPAKWYRRVGSGTLGDAFYYDNEQFRDTIKFGLGGATNYLVSESFYVNPDSGYEAVVRWRRTSGTGGLQYRFWAISGDMPDGYRAICGATSGTLDPELWQDGSSPDVVVRTSGTFSTGTTNTWYVDTVDYTPNASDTFSSFGLLNSGATSEFEIDYVFVRSKSTRNTGALADLNTVDTSEISDQAVNVLKSEYTADNLDATQSYQNVNTLSSVATEGAPVVINFFCRSFITTVNTNSCSHYFYLYRDTTPIQLFTGLNYCPGNSSSGGSVALSYVDYGATGTHTYYMKYQQSTSTANTSSSYVDYRSMTAMAVLDQP